MVEGFLLDTYSLGNTIIVWLKTQAGNVRIVVPYSVNIYAEPKIIPLPLDL